jgi:hypothetical protein
MLRWLLAPDGILGLKLSVYRRVKAAGNKDSGAACALSSTPCNSCILSLRFDRCVIITSNTSSLKLLHISLLPYQNNAINVLQIPCWWGQTLVDRAREYLNVVMRIALDGLDELVVVLVV